MLRRGPYYGASAFNSLLGTIRLCYLLSGIECTVTVIEIHLWAADQPFEFGDAGIGSRQCRPLVVIGCWSF